MLVAASSRHQHMTSGRIDRFNAIPVLRVRDCITRRPVLISRQRPAELGQRPEHESLTGDPAVEPVELGGLAPYLAAAASA